MTVLKSLAAKRSGARDKTWLFTVLCCILGGIILLMGIGDLVCHFTGKDSLLLFESGTRTAIKVVCVLIAIPILTLLISGYADGHARRGVGSTLLHIAIFGEAAILCIILGITGNFLLNKATKIQKQVPVRLEVFNKIGLQEGSLAPVLTKAVGIGESDRAANREFKSQVFDKSRENVKNFIEEELSAGRDDETVITDAVMAYAGNADIYYDIAVDAVETAVEENRAALCEKYSQELEKGTDGNTVIGKVISDIVTKASRKGIVEDQPSSAKALIEENREFICQQYSQQLLDGADFEFVINGVLNEISIKAKESYEKRVEAIKQAVKDNIDAICSQYHEEAEKAEAAINPGKMKDDIMNPKLTEHYALMYFGTALMVVGIILALFDVLLIILWSTRDEAGRAHIGERLEPLDYLLPFLIGVGVFTLYPAIRVFIMSFQEEYHATKNGAGDFTGWGLGNYRFVLGLQGSQTTYSDGFMRGLKNTSLYVLFTVPITAIIAIVIAYLLNQKSKLNALFQTVYFLPMVTTATAIGMVWKWMFNDNYGLINLFIRNITQFFGAPEDIAWLSTGTGINYVIPMSVLIIYGIWNSLPFTIILLLSGLQNIDENLYTVAKVDGSSGTRIFFKITVPLLSPTIGLVLIINSISAFKIYNEVYILWNESPNSQGMETVAWYIYDNINHAFDGTHSLGYAAAAAMILFAIIFVFTMVQKFIQRKWVYQ